jgi:hypothetical protein
VLNVIGVCEITKIFFFDLLRLLLELTGSSVFGPGAGVAKSTVCEVLLPFVVAFFVEPRPS